MSQHSLGYLAVLVAKLGQENMDNFGDVLAKCDTFIGVASPEQIRYLLLPVSVLIYVLIYVSISVLVLFLVLI